MLKRRQIRIVKRAKASEPSRSNEQGRGGRGNVKDQSALVVANWIREFRQRKMIETTRAIKVLLRKPVLDER